MWCFRPGSELSNCASHKACQKTPDWVSSLLACSRCSYNAHDHVLSQVQAFWRGLFSFSMLRACYFCPSPNNMLTYVQASNLCTNQLKLQALASYHGHWQDFWFVVIQCSRYNFEMSCPVHQSTALYMETYFIWQLMCLHVHMWSFNFSITASQTCGVCNVVLNVDSAAC